MKDLSWQPAVAGLSLAALVYLGLGGRRASSGPHSLTAWLQRRIEAGSPPPEAAKAGSTWPRGRHWDIARRLGLSLPRWLTGTPAGWARRLAEVPPLLSRELAAAPLIAVTGSAAACGCALGTLAVSVVWWFVAQAPAPAHILLVAALAGTGGGAAAAVLDVRLQAALWRRRLAADLPAFLALLAAGLRGGLDVRHAWAVAGEASQGPLGRLCGTVAAQLTAGRPFGAAVVEVAQAAGDDAVTEMALLLVEADAVGAPAIPSLEALAESTRQAGDAWRTARLARLPVQISLCCTLLILPAVLLVAMLPNVLRFLSFLG